MSSARTPERLWFVGNWSWEPATFRVPFAVSDLMAPVALEGQRHLDVCLGAFAYYERRRSPDLGEVATVPPLSWRRQSAIIGPLHSFSKTTIDSDRSEVPKVYRKKGVKSDKPNQPSRRGMT